MTDPLAANSEKSVIVGGKGRSLLLVAVLVSGGLLSFGWFFLKGADRSIAGSEGTASKPAVLKADLPRYEAVHQPFTVRFTAETKQEVSRDIFLFLLSDSPLHPSVPGEAEVKILKKGEKINFPKGRSFVLPCDGLRVKASKVGDQWVAEPGLSLEEIATHVLAYWFATDERWDNIQLTDNSIFDDFDARRFYPGLKGFSFRLGKVEVVSQQERDLLNRVDEALGQKVGGPSEFATSYFCGMGFGDQSWQVLKVLEKRKKKSGSPFADYLLFGMDKDSLKKTLVWSGEEVPEGSLKALSAFGKDFLWIEEGKEGTGKGRLFACINGKIRQVLTYNPGGLKGKGIVENLYINRFGTFQMFRTVSSEQGSGADINPEKAHYLEAYYWDNSHNRYFPEKHVQKLSYAQYLLQSQNYQDFLTSGFNRSDFESLLDYFTDDNNEGSTRESIHNLLVTASGTEFGEDKAAWRKWFEDRQKKMMANQ